MQEIKALFLLIAILGILDLTFALFYLPVKEVSSPSDLQSLEETQKVHFSGQVVSQKIYSTYSLLYLSNNLTLSHDSKINYRGKNISGLGKVDIYNKKTTIVVSEIKTE
ncbi:MAG: hypothetical protein WCK90_03255 [archaeon]